MATDKYKEFRNLMFNELEITKADIREWTRDATYEVAQQRARSIDVDAIVEREIERQVRAVVSPIYGNPTEKVATQIRKAVAETLADKIQISMK